MKYLLIILLFASCTVNKYYCLDCKQKKNYAEQIDQRLYLSPEITPWRLYPYYPEHFKMPYKPIDSGIFKWFGIPNGITVPNNGITYPIGETSDTSFLSFADTIISVSKDKIVVDSVFLKKNPLLRIKADSTQKITIKK